jgi:hypothetical protein
MLPEAASAKMLRRIAEAQSSPSILTNTSIVGRGGQERNSASASCCPIRWVPTGRFSPLSAYSFPRFSDAG